MAEKDLVSIVTPCLNPGSRLERCVQNLRGQSYPKIEHIVIDGGSTDGTIDVLNRTQDIVWISEPDTGQSNAINKGIALSKGGYVGWLGADDTLTDRAVEVVLDAFKSHPAASFAYGNVEVIESNRTYVVDAPSRLSLADFAMFNPIWQPGSLISRSAWDKVGGLDESIHLAMDFDLWLRLIVEGFESIYIPEILATYEIHASSKTGAVGREAFIMDCYRSYQKTGLDRYASLALGRAAANSVSSIPGSRIVGRRLDDAITEHLRVHPADSKVDERLVRAAARAEAAVLELQGLNSGIRHALHPGAWLVPETRARLLLALRRGLTRGRRPQG